jgi:hypothetical protein
MRALSASCDEQASHHFGDYNPCRMPLSKVDFIHYMMLEVTNGPHCPQDKSRNSLDTRYLILSYSR